MNLYEKKLKIVKDRVYNNQEQIDIAISIKNYIEDNYYRDLNLNVLSHHKFVSKYHLLRLFKKYYGLTPRQYLIDKRIEKSKEYLKKMSVTETCFAVGFSSLGSFSSLFKLKTGQSPSSYKRAILKK